MVSETASATSALSAMPLLSALVRLAERLYVFCIGARWQVDPNRLFDRAFYLSRNPDVDPARIDPLFHFLRFGAFEGRKPHPLFDPAYYLERYADVGRAKQNPLIHYLRFGGLEGRCPHPEFDGVFYLASRPDVAAKRGNPLVHFLEHGAEEGQAPHSKFDSHFYITVYPDVAAIGLLPTLHFAKCGAAEERRTHALQGAANPPEDYLPVRNPPAPRTMLQPVDVIVPVYRGLAETASCLKSVLSSRGTTPFRVIAIDDCSPDPALRAFLRKLEVEQKIVRIEHAENLGFVRSINDGLEISQGDVVLLNSDTMVFDGWLDRLSSCAYSNPHTGTVTPFSNNATICSYPQFASDNSIAPLGDPAALDATFAWVNRGRSVEIPTAVGFCMFIRRDCLKETGMFDSVTFGHGYGEENDFCMRAAAKGWTHKLACDVFVYHAGSVSFGEASARRKAAMQVLMSKHPHYTARVQQHTRNDPASAFRIAVTARRIRCSGKRVFLGVIHSLGGGVVQHVDDLAKATRDRVIWLTLKPSPHPRVTLECAEEGYQFSVALSPQAEYDQLATIAQACGVERIHIHHLMGHTGDLLRLVETLGVPFDFTVHDYFAICPQITLTDRHGRYCGECGPDACDRCIAERPPTGGIADIASWRAKYAWLFTNADRVLAPSADIAARMQRYWPAAKIIAAEHRSLGLPRNVVPRVVQAGEPLRIAVLGVMTMHKGLQLLQECAARARGSRLPLDFTLVGYVETALNHRAGAFRETGPYSENVSLILDEVAPHIIWFPAHWPETFSYTLSICLEQGLPAAAHGLGAFPERLGGRPWTWIVPSTWTSIDWVEFFLRIRKDHFLSGQGPEPPSLRPRALDSFYRESYLLPNQTGSLAAPATRRSNSTPIRIAAIVATHDSGQIQACGYVRVIQPLTHPAVADSVRLTVATRSQLLLADADVILIQRVAIRDIDAAESVAEACQRRRLPLIFEIDDDLFGIPPEHQEYEVYSAATGAAKWLARQADAVVVSTEALRQRMLPYNPRVLLLRNYLDERLWSRPPGDRPRFSKPLRVVYIGTNTHRDDLDLLGSAVRKLGATECRRIRFQVVGASDGNSSDWFDAIPLPGPVSHSYPRFVSWVQSNNAWHLGVAPLVDTPFNRAKSALKFLEYSALGLPSICSAGEAYNEAVGSTGAGLLTANTPEAWCEVLRRVVTDSELWKRLHANCAAVAHNNTIASNAEEIKSVWRAFAGREPLPASPRIWAESHKARAGFTR